jgi:hypothetical protein
VADEEGTALNVQIARGSGVATITLSEAEVRRFLAQSRVIVDDMRRALREAMELPAGSAETASKPKEPTRRETRISFSRTPQELEKLWRRAECRKALGLDP